MSSRLRKRRQFQRRLLVESLESRIAFWTGAANCPDVLVPMPMVSCDGCGCRVDGLSDNDPNTNGDCPPSNASTNPVSYFAGTPLVVSDDLVSQGFGKTFGHVRSWAGTNNTGSNGNGWVVTQGGYLFVYNTFDPTAGSNSKPVIAFTESGQDLILFDVSEGNASGTWPSRLLKTRDFRTIPQLLDSRCKIQSAIH